MRADNPHSNNNIYRIKKCISKKNKMQTKSKKNEAGIKSVVTNVDLNNRFVVMRNGSRVSDEEYSLKEDAQAEYDHWHRVVTRWPDGSKLEIVNLSKKGK